MFKIILENYIKCITIYVMEKTLELLQNTPTGGIYLTYQIYFNHYRYYFCQIVFSSDNWFQRRRLKFIIYVYKGNWPHLLAAMFSTDQI